MLTAVDVGMLIREQVHVDLSGWKLFAPDLDALHAGILVPGA